MNRFVLETFVCKPSIILALIEFFLQGERVVDLWGSAEGDQTYTGDSLQVLTVVQVLQVL